MRKAAANLAEFFGLKRNVVILLLALIGLVGLGFAFKVIGAGARIAAHV